MIKKTLYMGCALALLVSLSACQSQQSANNGTAESTSAAALQAGDNSQNSLDWAGSYHGVMPCADCPGISTALSIREDGSYELQTRYIDRGDSIFVEQGGFTWDPTGSYITLNTGEGIKYQVGENQLFALDMEGNRIEGGLAKHYILKKADGRITDIYWKLIEINGQSIENVKLMREPYLRLNTANNRAEANGGCNGMGGTYELNADNWRLSFSQFMSTQMACENMEIEQQLADVIQRTDSYAVASDTLQLFRARMAPLAKFKAVYVK